MRTEIVQSQNASIPETPKGQSGISPAQPWSTTPCFPATLHRDPAPGLLPGLWCLRAHEAWHCLHSTNPTLTWGLAPSLRSLLLVNICLAHSIEGWGPPRAPSPTGLVPEDGLESAGDKHRGITNTSMQPLLQSSAENRLRCFASPAPSEHLKRLQPGPQPIIGARLQIPQWLLIVQLELTVLREEPLQPAWCSFPPTLQGPGNTPGRFSPAERPPPRLRVCLGPSGLRGYTDPGKDPPHFSGEQTTARS